MLRYMPPKGNLWGHSMRRKSPEDLRACAANFLAAAADRHETIQCDISLSGSFDVEFLRGFIDETQIAATPAQLIQDHKISETEFERCLDWLIANRHKLPALDGPDGVMFILGRYHTIHEWKCADRGKPSQPSEFTEGYGSMQHIGTVFRFGSVAEYREIKAMVERIFGLELNDKHVRPKGVLG